MLYSNTKFWEIAWFIWLYTFFESVDFLKIFKIFFASKLVIILSLWEFTLFIITYKDLFMLLCFLTVFGKFSGPLHVQFCAIGIRSITTIGLNLFCDPMKTSFAKYLQMLENSRTFVQFFFLSLLFTGTTIFGRRFNSSIWQKWKLSLKLLRTYPTSSV